MSRGLDCIIEDQLYLGDFWQAKQLPLLQRHGITHIINLAAIDSNNGRFPEHFKYLAIHVKDFEEEPLDRVFGVCFRFMDGALDAKDAEDAGNGESKSRGRVFVHCMAGVSRSATIVVAYVMRRFHLDLKTALRQVQQKRPVVSPNDGFLKQLKAFEKMRQEIPAAVRQAAEESDAQAESLDQYLARLSLFSPVELTDPKAAQLALKHAFKTAMFDETAVVGHTLGPQIATKAHALMHFIRGMPSVNEALRELYELFLLRFPVRARELAFVNNLFTALVAESLLSREILLEALTATLQAENYAQLKIDLPIVDKVLGQLLQSFTAATLLTEEQVVALVAAQPHLSGAQAEQPRLDQLVDAWDDDFD
eukprot:m.630498 g.630498  ORF g.630498 m.630498 type:complete len:366 (-) comp58278_c0_seq4:153-1250(-)